MQVFFKIYLFFYVLIKHTQKYIDEYIVLTIYFSSIASLYYCG